MFDFKKIVQSAVEDNMKFALENPEQGHKDYTDFTVTEDRIKQNRYIVFEIEDILVRSLEIYHHELMAYLDDSKNKP